MPELPEVELARAELARWLEGARIVGASSDDRIVLRCSPRTFASRLTGRRVRAVDRKGKWLRVMLDDGTRLFSHLGMTGDWIAQRDPVRFERATLEIARGRRRTNLRYADARRLGRLVVSSEDIAAWSALGPDPLAEGIDVDRLSEKLARRKKRSIKEALMDQSVLAGVGNIQATEALWHARIDPRSRACALSRADLRAVARGIRWTIARTLADLRKGSERWQDSDVNPFVVYGRKGEPCPRCKTPLSRVMLGGRTTTFCAGCQRRAGA
jgi:formamidopyrimidine-DNA glycosylase